jgi:acetyltransferase-like isoleucine patch superfamily enzyme
VEEPLVRVAWRGKLLRPYRQLRFATFGQGSIVHKPAWVYGPHHIAIGERVVILEGAWLAAERSTWQRDEPSLCIGSGVVIRPHCTISATESVRIEDDVVMGSNVSIIDSDHTWQAGADGVLANPAVTAPVRIGAGTWLADRVAVLRGVTIGRRCAIGANSVVTTDVPDGSIAVGAPARVVGTTDRL